MAYIPVENSRPRCQSTVGYFHHIATASADQVIGNMMTERIIPATFHQDPRYFMLEARRRVPASIACGLQ